MTFLEQLQSHKGGLLRLKTELYWFGGRGWDGSPGRICLILDAAAALPAAARRTAATRTTTAVRSRTAAYATLLLIDGSPRWVRMAAEDVELL